MHSLPREDCREGGLWLGCEGRTPTSLLRGVEAEEEEEEEVVVTLC